MAFYLAGEITQVIDSIQRKWPFLVYLMAKFATNASGTTYSWPNLEPMQVAFYLAGEITQVKESIPWVRCASVNVFTGGLEPEFRAWSN